ncbi:MAG TPA: transporter substrate-binding domain-containing protein [Deltaproteobacteria bacterium]|nr:transporter substrate-binding domain-containing protein [Deltaproteobacteria bacterium]
MGRLIQGLFFMLLIMAAGSVWAAETIVLGAENDWVPYSNQDGTGMANEIVLAAYKAVGINVKFNVGPYNRLLKMVRDGEILGAFNIPKEKSNEKEYLFGKTPIFSAQSAYYQNVEHPLSVTSKEGLKNGEKIGVVFDYGYGDFFSGNDRIVKMEVRSDQLNLRKLAKGRIDATILYDKTARKLLKEEGLSDKIVKAFDSESGDIHVAFSKRFPNAQQYADKLDEGLAVIKASGILKQITDSY